ncbi:hypothetical protein FRC08_018373 [Ceratobasidium sp. 394]|nr:hypothetical protein FRC08_018373 [Ceratobasidium sp. 394]
MKRSPDMWIESQRMPPGITVLQDMWHWSRVELDAWITRFLDSQSGWLSGTDTFDMVQVPAGGSRPPIMLQGRPLPEVDPARFNWTSEELLYGEYMARQQQQEGRLNEHADPLGLPLARQSHIYVPFTIDLFQALMTLHKEHSSMVALIKEVACMEAEGLIHNEQGFLNGNHKDNAHVPYGDEPSLGDQLQPARWLGSAFFNLQSPNHSLWSVDTFKTWIEQKKPHIHLESGTVFGGPLGARVLVFACSRILQNLDCTRMKRPTPREISGYLTVEGLRGIEKSVTEVIARVRSDIAHSRAILKSSLEERRVAWAREVLTRVAQLGPDSDEDYSLIGVTATSGVPATARLLRVMAAHLDQSTLTGPACVSREAEGDASNSEYEVASCRYVLRKQAEESMERINITEILGSFDSEEEDENDEPIGNQILPPDLAVSVRSNCRRGTMETPVSQHAVVPEVVLETMETELGIVRRKSGRRAATKPEYVSAMEALKKGSTRHK